MRAAGQSVQHHKHGPRVIGPELLELSSVEEARPRRKRGVGLLKGLVYEVDRERSRARLTVRLEYFPLVVNGWAMLLRRRPHRLYVAIEEQRIQLAVRCRLVGDGREVCLPPILALQGDWSWGMCEGDACATEPVHGRRA